MKGCIKYFIAAVLLLYNVQTVKGQVIISLLFGDDLNTGKIEFGLDGGLNYSQLQGIDSKNSQGFHLGFYFDIRLKDPWKLHTGVIVKSPMGADNLPFYSTGDTALDHLLVNGNVETNLRYFNVPLMMKYSFKNRIYVEGGIQLGLLYKAFDKFSVDVNDEEDLTFVMHNKNQYNTLDAGLEIGAGWRIIKGYGMNLGVRYYLGLIDITKDDSADTFNRSLYLALGIPIGVGKARKKAEQKSGENNQR